MITSSIRNSIFLFLIIFWVNSLSAFSQSVTLYINEFQASNVSSVQDPLFHEYTDWIEIYNAGTSGVEIGGYYLTDNPQDPQKWKIPFDSVIHPGGYMVFWADNYNEFTHTNFKLGRSGEFIGLYDKDGNVVDSLSFGYQEDDISYGRILSNLESWVFFDIVSPGSANPDIYYDGRTENPKFSVNGGFYTGSQYISISTLDPTVKIHYTLDGTPPDESDPMYITPITIDSTMAIRVRAYSDGKLPGWIITQTYFINEEVNLPFVSLVTDPDNLFDDEIGIYVIGTNGVPGYCTDTPMNLNQDWERPVNVEIYDKNGRVEINQRAGVKIFGGCSRTRYPQKSFELFARGIYGEGSFDYQLFKDKPIYTFESFLLRSSADDVVHTMFKDGMGQTILEGMDIDRQAYRPAVVFINGQYWGIHNIREKISEHYVAGNYNIDADEVNLLKRNPERPYNVVSGSADHYNNLILYVNGQDMTDENVYQYVTKQMDINNYIDYQIAEIYLSANDWPGNNIKFWRANSAPNDKWRWIIYDLDNCFFYIERNTLELAADPGCNCVWPNPPWSTLLFRRLLEYENFRNEFIQRYAWHMNTTFLPDRIYYLIDSIKANIAPEIPRHIERWGGQLVPDPESWIRPTFNSIEEWEGNINYMKMFVSERRYPATQHVLDYFALEGMANLSIYSDHPEMGKIKINNQTIQGIYHSGDYFMNVPLRIKAISSFGHKFSHWDYTTPGSGTKQVKNPVLDIILEEDLSLVAYFENTEELNPVIVINEINYHSDDEKNPGDWLELYNRKDEIIELTRWTFKDENDDHVFTFPDGLEIGPNDYLVLCEDISAFRRIFKEVDNCVGNLGFGLSNGGELIRLYSPDHVLVDAVQYDDENPWPEEPDGNGPTLELLDPSLNNDFADSWVASYDTGTPGRQNFSNTIENHSLAQNYPNPCNSKTRIPFSIVSPGFVNIKVYDIFGREITSLLNAYKEVATYEVEWDTANLPTGVYLCAMWVDHQPVGSKKIIINR